MPLLYGVADGVLELRIEGTYSGDDLRAFSERIRTDASLPHRFQVLADIRRSNVVPAPAEMELRIQLIAAMRDRIAGRIAILVSDDLRFGIARVLEAHVEPLGIEVRPFRDMAAARAWLGAASA
jgi:hypothetical protein